VPILANGLRAFGIVLIGYLSDMKAAVGFDHIVYGWLLFAIITAILLAIGMAFRDREIGEMPAVSGPPASAPPASRRAVTAAAASVLILAAAAPAYAALVMDAAPPAKALALGAPEMGNGWRLAPEHRDDWTPVYPTADASVIRSYVKDGKVVHLFIAYYRYQRGQAEVVTFGNRLYDGKRWVRAGSGYLPATIDGAPVKTEMTRLLQGHNGRVVLSWQWVDDTFTADGYYSKLLTTKAKLLGGKRAAALIAVAADYRDGPADAIPVLRDFLSSLPPMRPFLAGVAGP
jgi:EpsI family protein